MRMRLAALSAICHASGFRSCISPPELYGRYIIGQALQSQSSCTTIRSSATKITSMNSTPAPKQFKLALCQLAVSANKQANLKGATQAIKEAAGNGAKLVVLPEMFNCPYSNDSFPTYAEDIDGESSECAAAMSAAAKESSVVLVAGSIPETSQGKLFNTCLVFDKQGTLLAKHRKIHLFDIDIPGKQTFKESDTLSPGKTITVVDTSIGRLGIGICYDIRFPELAMLYAKRGVQLIVYPGAFNVTTGPVHWELLQRARAVDNQLYVATCSPARDPDFTYKAWGHSSVFDPWGECLGTTDHKPSTVYADLDFNEIITRRTNMPLESQKRYDLYDIVDKA